jgi:hypothetical protein
MQGFLAWACSAWRRRVPGGTAAHHSRPWPPEQGRWCAVDFRLWRAAGALSNPAAGEEDATNRGDVSKECTAARRSRSRAQLAPGGGGSDRRRVGSGRSSTATRPLSKTRSPARQALIIGMAAAAAGQGGQPRGRPGQRRRLGLPSRVAGPRAGRARPRRFGPGVGSGGAAPTTTGPPSPTCPRAAAAGDRRAQAAAPQ